MKQDVSALSSDQNQPGAWRALPILMVLSALSLLDRQVLSLLVGPMKHDLHISDFQVGLLQGLAFAIFYSVAGIPIGWLADRFPRRPVIWLGVTVWGLAASACGLASTYAGLLAARLMVGAGEAALSPAANSMLADLFKPTRLAVALSVLSMGSNLGNGLAIGLGGLVVSIAEHGGALALPLVGELRTWQFVFLVTGAPGLVLGLLVFLVREPKRRAHSQAHGQPDFRRTLAFLGENRSFYAPHMVGFALYSVAAWAFLSWLPTFMVRTYGWTIGQVSLPLAIIVALGAPAGTLITGWIVDRRFARGGEDAHLKVFAVIALGLTVLGAVAFQVGSPILFLVLATPIVGVMTLAPAATAALQIVTPNQMRGQINALFLLMMNGVGIAVGPPLAGAITDYVFHDEQRIGDSISLVFLLIMPIAAGLLWLGCRPMRGCVDRAKAWRT